MPGRVPLAVIERMAAISGKIHAAGASGTSEETRPSSFDTSDPPLGAKSSAVTTHGPKDSATIPRARLGWLQLTMIV